MPDKIVWETILSRTCRGGGEAVWETASHGCRDFLKENIKQPEQFL